jgi:TolB protein
MRHLCAILFFSLITIAIAQGPVQLPDVIGTSEVRSRQIRLEGNPDLVRQAQRLFSLHGGTQIVASGEDFTFRFEAIGNAVQLNISSAGNILWEERFPAPSALVKAADAAVQRTLGTRGFFGSRIVFVSDRTGHAEIYSSDLLFQNLKQLTRDRSQCLSPNLSPDGRSLLYTSYHGSGFPDIYHVDLTTGQRTVFAGFKGTNTGATFSPDGRQVAMILSGSGNSELYTANPQGRQLRRMTRTKSLEADPTWSPDGQRIAFTSDQMGKPQIYVMSVQGRAMERVRTDISRNCSEPTWNPREANLIAFTAASAGEFEVAVYDYRKGASTILTRGPGDAVHPVWLCDGRHLIYTERTSRYSRLMILDTATGKRFQLSPAQLNNASEASVIYVP